jgi:predicted nucleotidyltransferase
MSAQVGTSSPVVDWDAGARRRRQLEAELGRTVAALPRLGVQRAIVFGSAARGDVRGQSDLDLILIADSREPFSERCARFYGELEPAVGLDLLVYTPQEFEELRARPFLARALAGSRIVYEA